METYRYIGLGAGLLHATCSRGRRPEPTMLVDAATFAAVALAALALRVRREPAEPAR